MPAAASAAGPGWAGQPPTARLRRRRRPAPRGADARTQPQVRNGCKRRNSPRRAKKPPPPRAVPGASSRRKRARRPPRAAPLRRRLRRPFRGRRGQQVRADDGRDPRRGPPCGTAREAGAARRRPDLRVPRRPGARRRGLPRRRRRSARRAGGRWRPRCRGRSGTRRPSPRPGPGGRSARRGPVPVSRGRSPPAFPRARSAASRPRRPGGTRREPPGPRVGTTRTLRLDGRTRTPNLGRPRSRKTRSLSPADGPATVRPESAGSARLGTGSPRLPRRPSALCRPPDRNHRVRRRNRTPRNPDMRAAPGQFRRPAFKALTGRRISGVRAPRGGAAPNGPSGTKT